MSCNYCPDCGKPRPAPEAEISEEERLAREIEDAGRAAMGSEPVSDRVWNTSVKTYSMAALAKARELCGAEAEKLRERVDELREELENRVNQEAGAKEMQDYLRAESEKLRAERDELKQKLAGYSPTRSIDSLRALKDGWDSYGGKAPTEAALKTAESIVRAVHVAPVSDGGVQIEMGDKLVSIGPDGMVMEEQDPARPPGMPLGRLPCKPCSRDVP